MPNLYGVANPLPLPAVYSPASDTTCSAGSETTVITSGAIAQTLNGSSYPRIDGVLTILLGGTAPSALVLAFKLGSGSDVDTYTVEPGLLVNSAELIIPLHLLGVSSATAWVGSGSTVNVTVNATGQAVTCKKVGSRAIIGIFRGSD